VDHRLTLITLGVADHAAARAFYERVSLALHTRGGGDGLPGRGHDRSRAHEGTVGYTGVFVDPDGHPWEVAHNPGFELREDG
jgi:hypothetical protein